MPTHDIGGELRRSRRPILSLRTGSHFQFTLLILAAMFFFAFRSRADAQLTIVHSFGDGTVVDDGAVPQAGLIQAPNGYFFGVTNRQANQPTILAGTVFQMTSSGKVSVIYHFGLKSNSFSNEPLLYYRGKLIGVTQSSTGTGSLFALNRAASTGKWRLSYWQKNVAPEGNLILGSDGNFYGVGGVSIGGGVYKINPTTHALTIVYGFPLTSNYATGPGLLEASDGNFYGTTMRLPNLQYLWGAIFQLTPSGQATFTQYGGFEGAGPLIQASNGNLYGLGTTFDDIGTSSPGAIVYTTPSSGVGGFLHLFGQGTDGSFPVGALVQGPNGDLYGITLAGGTAGHGVLFEISTLGAYQIVHNFGDGSVPNDGLAPAGTLIVGSDNNLYGTTTAGGTAGLGTVFKFTP